MDATAYIEQIATAARAAASDLAVASAGQRNAALVAAAKNTRGRHAVVKTNNDTILHNFTFWFYAIDNFAHTIKKLK